MLCFWVVNDILFVLFRLAHWHLLCYVLSLCVKVIGCLLGEAYEAFAPPFVQKTTFLVLYQQISLDPRGC